VRLAIVIVNKAGAQVCGITLEEVLRNPTRPITFDGYTMRLIVEPGEGFIGRQLRPIKALFRAIFQKISAR
jgi:hypothetical protein